MVEYYNKKRLSMITALSMIILLMGNIPYLVAQQQQTFTICFYVDSPSNPFSPGHGFVQLIDSANPNSGKQVYGKYPGGWNLFGGKGEIKDDSKRNWDWKICYTVTAAQYNAVVNFITNEIKNPSNYNLTGTNCVSWQQTIAGLAGITLPTTKNRVSIDDPYAFEQTLEAIGNNGLFGTGKVVSNTNSVTPVNSPVPTIAQQAQNPQQCSYDGIKQYAMEDSAKIAEALHLDHIVKENEPINTSLQVSFMTEVNPNNSMIIWDFGDGTQEYQVNSVQHNYSTGSFTPNVLIIDNDSVIRSFFDINVSPEFPPAQIFVDVPPATQTFPYTPGPGALPPVIIGPPGTPVADSFFDVFIDVKLDPGGHGPFIGMPSQIQLQAPRTDSSIIFDGPAPWVDVSGTIQSNGSFMASGTGTVAGFPNILVNFQGSIADGSLSGDYTMGVNGGLPGGQPIIYNVNGQLIADGQPPVIAPPQPGTMPDTLTLIPNVKSRTVLLGNTAEFTFDVLAPSGFTHDFTIIPRAMQQARNLEMKLFPPINIYDETLQGYRDVGLAVTPSQDASPSEVIIVLGVNYMDPITAQQVFLDDISRVTVNINEMQAEQDVMLSLSMPMFFTPKVLTGEPVQIPSIVINEHDVPQPFTYIVLITDRFGYTVFTNWITGSVEPNSQEMPYLEWEPLRTGNFNINTFLWSSLENPAPLAPAMNTPILASIYQPDFERTTPIISTRGHFDEHVFADPTLTSGHTATDYDTTGDIPGIGDSPCPEEIVIYVHGFQNDEQSAIENFDTAKKALESNGYKHPVIGFSWDSDTGSLDFDDAKNIAEQNGKKLAQFILDYKKECPDTKIRLIGHSMGARVILNALESLHNNEEWNENDWKVTSAHVVGAAVDNEEVSKDGGFGNAIEDEVEDFYNKYNHEDNVLSGLYWPEEGDQALGENGAESGIPLPDNYHEEDVTSEVGDDHSAYNGTVDKDGNLTDDGIMDNVVEDWKAQGN